MIARREPVAVAGVTQTPPIPKRHPPRSVRPSAVGEPYLTMDGDQTNGRFGHTVAGAGDVNGDGFADVLVGAFGAGTNASGEVLLYYGSPKGIRDQESWRFTCPVAGAEFGHQVEGVGDVNRDGFSDFIVGATYYSKSEKPARTGGAFLFLGGKDGPGARPDWEMVGDEPDSSTGFAVAAAGDVNGDGFADVLIGAWNQSPPEGLGPHRGRVALYLGGPRGLSTEPAWVPYGEQVGSQYGYSLHGIGDVNGDGFDDIAIGSHSYEAEQKGAGRVYVYYGGKQGPRLTPDWTITGTDYRQMLGNSVFGAGDVNGDGFDDLLIAANSTCHPESGEGMVLVVHGSPSGLEPEVSWTFEPNRVGYFLGHSVAGAGDINGDGYSDIVVSAMNGTQFVTDEGMSFAFHGSAKGLSRRPDWTFCGGQSRGGYGSTVRCAGDVDGDGFDDVVVGHTYYSGAIPRQGRVWLFPGSRSGLSASSRWNWGLESVGFSYRSVTLPLPNAAWISLSGVLAGAVLILATRSYYRRRELRAVALQQTREAAQQQERQRLAQDLHDFLGADLTEMVLASANARLQSPQNGLVERKLMQLEKTASRLIGSLAEIVWLTKPTNDTLPRLTDYFGNLAGATLEKADFACVLDLPDLMPDVPVPFELRHDLVLSLKEALHNAIKHSGGDTVTVRARFRGGDLDLEIRDNGRGFQPHCSRVSGNGISNMRSRIAHHGGSVRWEDSADGVTVFIHVPINSRRN